MQDYKRLGFRCGLEIHQQLEGEKLFCHCRTLNTDKEPEHHATRKLRAVVGETGEVDKAAAYEMAKGKRFSYSSHSSDTCLVEYDEEPPTPLNARALETAIQVALLLNARIVDEIHVMRKIVVDGSNVTGFQRTALIAMDGYIETEEGRVEIPSICLEEEAAQKLKSDEKKAQYKLDRLGIPLIEIATNAAILSPEHAKKVAGHIGMVLRSVEGVKRGLGTIRQDVNISIQGGARTEVKGFQDLRSIPKVIDFEIRRQQEAISNGEKIEAQVRKAEGDFTTSFLRPMPGAARMYPETDVLPVRVPDEYLKKLKENLPALVGDRIKEFQQKYGVSEGMAKELMEKASFERFVKKFSDVKPTAVAQILVDVPKDLKKRLKLDISKLSEKDFEEVLGYLDTGKVPRDSVPQLLEKRIKGEKIDLSEFKGVDDAELEQAVKKVIAEKPGLNAGGYMGLLMKEFRGKVEGKKIMEMVKKCLQ